VAGVTDYQQDLVNGRAFSMWEENGIQYRSNLLLRPGATIPLHAHSYDHTARILGRMRMTVSGIHSEVANDEVFIPAWQQHTFTLIEGIDGVGEVLCYWRSE
jgi:hypothetical protein